MFSGHQPRARSPIDLDLTDRGDTHAGYAVRQQDASRAMGHVRGAAVSRRRPAWSARTTEWAGLQAAGRLPRGGGVDARLVSGPAQDLRAEGQSALPGAVVQSLPGA